MLVANQAVRKYAALESNVITKLSGHYDTNPAVVANKLKLLKKSSYWFQETWPLKGG